MLLLHLPVICPEWRRGQSFNIIKLSNYKVIKCIAHCYRFSNRWWKKCNPLSGNKCFCRIKTFVFSSNFPADFVSNMRCNNVALCVFNIKVTFHNEQLKHLIFNTKISSHISSAVITQNAIYTWACFIIIFKWPND